MKKLLLGLISLYFLTACSTTTPTYTTYYQVLSVTPENAHITSNGSPVFRTDDGLEFTYNFWGEFGKLRFTVHNTNDYDIIIDMTKSSFIRNNIAEDYYQGRQSEKERSPYVDYLAKTSEEALAAGVRTTPSKVGQRTAITKEPEIVRIPAKSAKVFHTFYINNIRFTDPKLRVEFNYSPITFTKYDSPLVMRNRICAYKEGTEPSFHNMDFYISEVGNVNNLIGLGNPKSFYVSYSSKSDDNSNIKIGSEVTYNGVPAYIGYIADHQLILAAKEFSKGTWDEAVKHCDKLGNGWKLPSVEELKKIRDQLINYNHCWTIEEVNEKKAKIFKYYDRNENKDKIHTILPIAIVNPNDLK